MLSADELSIFTSKITIFRKVPSRRVAKKLIPVYAHGIAIGYIHREDVPKDHREAVFAAHEQQKRTPK